MPPLREAINECVHFLPHVVMIQRWDVYNVGCTGDPAATYTSALVDFEELSHVWIHYEPSPYSLISTRHKFHIFGNFN